MVGYQKEGKTVFVNFDPFVKSLGLNPIQENIFYRLKKNHCLLPAMALTEFCTANKVDSNIILTELNAPINTWADWKAFCDALLRPLENTLLLRLLYIGDPAPKDEYIPGKVKKKENGEDILAKTFFSQPSLTLFSNGKYFMCKNETGLENFYI